MKNTFCLILSIFAFLPSIAQQKKVTFTSSDKDVQSAFEWASATALSYKGVATDPVGPWYESALPPRAAFCMRDVSHQSIGAEILGMSSENANMFHLFASNISASKNWCSFWEINKFSKPAPEDYRNDQEFWYNLPANFDLLNASWRLYLWTGNKEYINGKAFTYFQEKSVLDYIDQWVLSPDAIFNRPAHPNAPAKFNEADSFHRCRGLPSYSEGIPDLKMGVDLVAALYQGMLTYSRILKVQGRQNESISYSQKAEKYRRNLEKYWWDEKEQLYHTYFSNDGKFGKEEGETFLLWFDALKDTTRINKTINHIASKDWNMENTSYYPYIFYQHGYWDKARAYILYLSNPATKRREYPEVSFGVIQGVVQGLMGISPDARTRTISTKYNSNRKDRGELKQLPIFGTVIDITHFDNRQSEIVNNGNAAFLWKAAFHGKYSKANVNGKKLLVKHETDQQGRAVSYVETSVKPGQKLNIKVED